MDVFRCFCFDLFLCFGGGFLGGLRFPAESHSEGNRLISDAMRQKMSKP